jgi:hypothetical protein
MMTTSSRRSLDNVVSMPMNETPTEADQQWDVSDEVVARRAYELYCARGSEDGRDIDDWLAAEREVHDEGLASFPARLGGAA